jgi:hypothetical protein
MKTNRLSEKLSTALNEQMTKHMLLKSTYRMPRGITMDLLVSQIFFCSAAGTYMMKILEYI